MIPSEGQFFNWFLEKRKVAFFSEIAIAVIVGLAAYWIGKKESVPASLCLVVPILLAASAIIHKAVMSSLAVMKDSLSRHAESVENRVEQFAELTKQCIQENQLLASEQGGYFIPCLSNTDYLGHAQSISGKNIVAYHPMQNLMTVEDMTESDERRLRRMKSIYDDIMAEKINTYEWYVEIGQKDQKQARALISRVKYLLKNYASIVRNGSCPIGIHFFSPGDPQVFPFHFQVTRGDDSSQEQKNLIFGMCQTLTVNYGALFLRGGTIWSIFDSICGMIKERFRGNYIIDSKGRINKDLIISICENYSLQFPEEVNEWQNT